MATAVTVSGLGKQYRLGGTAYRTLRDDLAAKLHAPFRAAQSTASPARGRDDNRIWALRNLSLDVAYGDVLGVIGRNGAGKSTLLKVLARIVEPTEGYAEMRGRTGTLLEVGTGFHPELTGRENVFLSGAILGMRRREIARKLDAIVAFAEVERFIDTPVKHYSSGMHMRLGFAVAAHLEPEILLVDEVIAVGDTAFQAKCLGRMGEVAREGRTVIFVSHNLLAVEGLCNRVVWLENGRVADAGRPSEVVRHYLRDTSAEVREHVWDDPHDAPGNDQARLRRIIVRPLDGSSTDLLTVRTPFAIEVEIWNLREGAFLNLGLTLVNAYGTVVFEAGPLDEPSWQGRPYPRGLFRDVCYVPGDLLNDGAYTVELHVATNGANVIYRHDRLLTFAVADDISSRSGWYGEWSGVVRPILRWTTDLVERW
jgi:lipopolysaccharide transport system ATP-binding protein